MATKEFDFEIGDAVEIKDFGISAVVIGLWADEGGVMKYQVRWKRKDDGVQESWFYAKDLEKDATA